MTGMKLIRKLFGFPKAESAVDKHIRDRRNTVHILVNVKGMGQREAARRTGIPRTTIQDDLVWLKRHEGQQ